MSKDFLKQQKKKKEKKGRKEENKTIFAINMTLTL